MLVLSRQRDETIMIGDDIEITIVDIRGDKVRLGITAPNTIPVHRKEVYEAIQRENREAAKVKTEDFSNLPKTAIRSSVPPGTHRPNHLVTKPGQPGENKPGNPPAAQSPASPNPPKPATGSPENPGPASPSSPAQ
jgi:carbon storage regulator